MWRNTAAFPRGMCYSFESPKVFDKLRIPEGDVLRRTVEILNPLGEDFSIMRDHAAERYADLSGHQL